MCYSIHVYLHIYIYGLNSFTNTSNPPPVTFSSTNQKKQNHPPVITIFYHYFDYAVLGMVLVNYPTVMWVK